MSAPQGALRTSTQQWGAEGRKFMCCKGDKRRKKNALKNTRKAVTNAR